MNSSRTSKPLTKQLKIYSNKDFKSAGRLDRIHMSMIEERFLDMLSNDEALYGQQLQLAYMRCYKELRRSAAVKYIQNNIPGCESWYKANRLLDDMQALFGRFIDKNQLLKRQIVVERMYETAERIKEIADSMYEEKNEKDEEGKPIPDFGLEERRLRAADMYERAVNILEKAGKMEGLDKAASGIDPRDFELPEVVVTNDPRALREGVEEAEMEEEE